MKIVSWNCNGSFRTKYKRILELDADIYVIQECEPPSEFRETELTILTANSIWEKGANKKGLLIFSKENVKIEKLLWDNYGMRVFIPLRVNGKFTLVGVWTTKPAYIEEFYIWQLVNEKKLKEDTVLIGDFNSNAIWDKKHNTRSHTEVVKMLQNKGLESIYHSFFNEKQGEETTPTFFMYKKRERPFHIDYCFASKKCVKSYKILDERWLDVSDHVPIVLEIKDKIKGEDEEC